MIAGEAALIYLHFTSRSHKMYTVCRQVILSRAAYEIFQFVNFKKCIAGLDK